MQSGEIVPSVFISYSHKDAQALAALRSHLNSAVGAGSVRYWADTQIAPGTPWRAEITRAIESARVAILLVSPNFFASAFIERHETPPLLAAAVAGEITLIPVILSKCDFERSPLAKFQSANTSRQPVDGMPSATQAATWVHVTNLVLQHLAQPRQAPAPSLTRDQIKSALTQRKERILGELKRMDLSGKNLAGVNLAGLDLTMVTLDSANLRRADLSDIQADAGFIFSGSFARADLSFAILRRAKIGYSSLKGALLRGANLSGANLNGSNCEGADLYGANLSGASLLDATLSGANLEGVDARKAAFRGIWAHGYTRVRLVGANLQGVDLSGCGMRDSDLTEVDLRDSTLSGADLRGSILSQAQLQGANLRNADLRDVDLSGASIERTSFNGAKYDSLTRWPRGFDPFSSGAIEAPSR